MFVPETFIVRAVDDGMEPRIRAGDYVCVDADKAPAVDGSVVLFGRGADAVVRRLVVGADGRRVLRAARDGYPEIVVDADNEADIRGVAVFAGRAI